MENPDSKSPLLTPSGSDHETMDSWTFVDESKNQQQPEGPESSTGAATAAADFHPTTSSEVKPESTKISYQCHIALSCSVVVEKLTHLRLFCNHLSVDQDNDTELSDGISIISESDCGGRHTPSEDAATAASVDVEKKSKATETTFLHPTPPPTPLTLVPEERRLAETCSDLVEKEDDFVRGVFGIGRRHVMMVILLAGISGAMFGHLFRAMPGPPCDCTKLIEPLMNRVYDLEVENFRLRDEVTKLTKKILSESVASTTELPPNSPPVETPVQRDQVWTGDQEEAIVEPLHDESICGANTGDDLFDEYYGQKCREAEEKIKEARKAFSEYENQPKTPQKTEQQPQKDRRDQKQYKEERKPDKKYSEDKEKDKRDKYRERESKEDRRNNSKERFDERQKKKDKDWSGEKKDNNRREKMKKGERKDYDDDDDDSRERRNNGDRRKERKNGKKWRDDDDDDDDSREDKRRKNFDPDWHEKRAHGREKYREKESDEKEGNWYLERGSDREIKRLRVEDSHERRR